MKKADIDNKIKFATDIIIDMQKSGLYNPIDALQGTETKQQKLYSFCVQFIYDIEELTARFEHDLKKCL